MNAIEHLQDYTWTTPDSYGGHNPVGDYVVATITRDSGILDQSNWHALRKIIEKHSEIGVDYDTATPNTPYDFRAGHWACGWVEYLIIPASNANEALLNDVAEALCSLQDYPILDEDDWSEREYESAENYWEQMRTAERVEVIKDYAPEVSIFAARHDYIPQNNGGLDEYLRAD